MNEELHEKTEQPVSGAVHADADASRVEIKQQPVQESLRTILRLPPKKKK